MFLLASIVVALLAAPLPISTAVLQNRATERCPDAEITESISAAGVDFIKFICPSGFPTTQASSAGLRPVGKITPASPPSLVRRQTGCGEACVAFCETGTSFPSSSDCTSLAFAINTFTELFGTTFAIAAGTVASAAFGTCEFIWANESEAELGFCWSQFENIGVSLNEACVEEGEPAGLCFSDSGDWAFELLGGAFNEGAQNPNA